MAFMLPVATPPNAIAYASGEIAAGDMAKAGFVLNLLCAFWITAMTHWLAVLCSELEVRHPDAGVGMKGE